MRIGRTIALTSSTARSRMPAALAFGTTAAAGGRASLAFADTAIKGARAGEVDAVVAAPQNETSIARAGIKFDGYPSFVARATGTDENDVYLMLCFGDIKIVHATLHRSVRDAVAMITRERVIGAIGAAERALRLIGMAAPKIAVSGLNPHAGEGGLFGREEIEIIKPAIDAAVARGIAATGPFGADTMFHMPRRRCLRGHAARPGPHRREASGAERHRGGDDRHADPVLLGRARQRPRHRRQRRRQSRSHDRSGAAAVRGQAARRAARAAAGFP